MKPSQPRDLPWSLERTPGWRGQFERTRRWRQRLLASAGKPDVQFTFDCALAFFINCYHLRDWLARSGEVSQLRLDELFRDSFALRVCADLANIAKHYDLTNTPRLTRQLSIACEYADPGYGWFGDRARLTVLSDGQKLDLLELTAACEVEWVSFLKRQSLIR